VSSISSISPYLPATAKTPSHLSAAAHAPTVVDRKNDGDKDDGVTSTVATNVAPTSTNQAANQFTVNKLA
jgi:hypothetical protein